MVDRESFDALRTLVENIYTNKYLAKQLPKWNTALQKRDDLCGIQFQRDFYKNYVKRSKDRTVVIISDAMRYEVGREMFLRLADDPKCTAKLEVQLSVPPSYTRLGMAALLPHDTLAMTDDFRVLADDVLSDNLTARQTVLKKYKSNSICVQFDDIKSLNRAELRKLFPGNDIVYVYHNQIDARGDKANTEDEVFNACEEAIKELIDFIHTLSTSVNTQHCIVTADHGFRICIHKAEKVV